MSCYYPVSAWKARRFNESGKRGIVFSPRDGFEDMALQVPCGKCIGCKSDKAMMWSIRCYHEASLHERNAFVTLTYEDAPPALVKEDLQKFFKRARHSFDFRYFACGEYGEATHRPHYHALIFGQDFLDDAIDISDSLYTSSSLSKLWGHGLISVAPVTMASCCYVAGYVHKKVGDDETFTLMSRQPGIGKDWLAKYGDDLRRTGTVTIEGKELPVPMRYLAWEEEMFSDLKRERAKRFRDMTPDERYKRACSLPARELSKKAQVSQRRGSI